MLPQPPSGYPFKLYPGSIRPSQLLITVFLFPGPRLSAYLPAYPHPEDCLAIPQGYFCPPEDQPDLIY